MAFFAIGFLSGLPQASACSMPLLASQELEIPFTGDTRVHLTGRLDRGAIQHEGDGIVRLELELRGLADPSASRVRLGTDMIVVLDRSGSMEGGKIEHARRAVRELIDQLTARDRFALVAYSDQATLLIPLSGVETRSKERWREIAAAVTVDGYTNLSGGLDLARQALEHSKIRNPASRVILISDGLANRGDTSHEGLMARARHFKQTATNLTAIGVGLDFNEVLMSSLADTGLGNFYYVDDSEQLAEIFTQEFDASRTTIAQSLVIEIDAAPGVEVVDAGGYPITRQGDTFRFHPGNLSSGQTRSVWVTFKVPSGHLGDTSPGRVRASYLHADPSSSTLESQLAWSPLPAVACVNDEAQYLAAFNPSTWARAVQEETFNKLRQDVAKDVREGQRAEAIEKIAAFKKHHASVNATLNSSEVEEVLQQTGDLENDVEQAFQGSAAEQSYRQNVLSKEKMATALDGRRKGSKQKQDP